MNNDMLLQQCGKVGVIPVLVIEDLATAVPVAESLIEGGLTVLEVALRSEAAWDAAEKMVKQCSQAVVGVGSVLQPDDLTKAVDIGAHFCVSPGFTPKLLETALKLEVCYLPGVSTVSEMLFVRERGLRFMKFFPSELSGGSRMLKSVSGPVSDIQFCPTGGVTPTNLPEYLACPNVVCVGGTWLVNKEDLQGGNYDAIRNRAVEAASIVSTLSE